jgi:hypothetical protein
MTIAAQAIERYSPRPAAGFKFSGVLPRLSVGRGNLFSPLPEERGFCESRSRRTGPRPLPSSRALAGSLEPRVRPRRVPRGRVTHALIGCLPGLLPCSRKHRGYLARAARLRRVRPRRGLNGQSARRLGAPLSGGLEESDSGRDADVERLDPARERYREGVVARPPNERAKPASFSAEDERHCSLQVR